MALESANTVSPRSHVYNVCVVLWSPNWFTLAENRCAGLGCPKWSCLSISAGAALVGALNLLRACNPHCL